MLSLLMYVPRYKEIEVYVEKNTMEVISESNDNLLILKIHYSGNFTSLPDRRYRYAVITLYALVDSKRILGKSLDEGLTPLISHQDVLSLLKYVPRYKEIEVYVEKHMMEVVSGKGKGKVVVIEEIVEDDEVNEASETGNRVYPYDWQQDPYDRDDEAKENSKLVVELDNLLEHLPFLNDELKENVVGVDAPVVVIEEQLERIEHVVDEDIERPRKRKIENKDESASANVHPFEKIKQEEKVESS
ncbi:hypothetical protein Tco_1442731 [Tanacetum coccineum]